MHYYQHHIGDFIRDTSRLSEEQCMAYMRLIWAYYESEQPLPNNPRSLAFRIGASEEVVSLILEAFFKLEDGAWRHTRCDSEIAEYKAICNRNKTNGKAGGRPKKTQSVSDGLPEETQPEPHRNPNQYPVTSNQEDQKPAAAEAAPKPKRKTKSALPTPFLLSTDMAKWARERAPSVDLNLETEKFCNHWRSKGETRADWLATWYNWMLRAQEYAKQPRQGKQAEPDFDDISWAKDLGPL